MIFISIVALGLPDQSSPLVKVAMPLAAIVLVLGVARIRQISARDVIGLKAPPMWATLLCLALAAGWMLA